MPFVAVVVGADLPRRTLSLKQNWGVSTGAETDGVRDIFESGAFSGCPPDGVDIDQNHARMMGVIVVG